MPGSKAHKLLLRWKVRGNLFLGFWMPEFPFRPIESQSLGSKQTDIGVFSDSLLHPGHCPALSTLIARATGWRSRTQHPNGGAEGGEKGPNSPYLSVKTWGGALVGVPGGSGVARLQEVTPSGGPQRWAIAPSHSAFVTASRGCQEELQHRFLKSFAVARTARCRASRASGKSRRHRAEPRRGEHSQCELSVEPEADGDCSRRSSPRTAGPRLRRCSAARRPA